VSIERARSAIRVLFGYALHFGHWLSRQAIAALAFCFFVVLALLERTRTSWRRRRGARPRLLWGPSAIISNKYWSEAMRAIGYESRTCIIVDSAITTREDWDLCRDEFLGGRYSDRLRSYAMFAWAMRHAEVFLFFFNGGYLIGTPLEWQEFRLLRLAGKKLVFSPFGGDIAVPDYLGEMKEATLADYPQLVEQAPLTRRRVLHSLKWADVSIRNITIGFLPAFDVVWLTQLGIDAGLWRPDGTDSGSDGHSEPVVVLHAPNHRGVNGTDHLERAVRQLRDEGLKIDLRILEGQPNEQIRAAMHAADLVADQFLDPGYGLFPIEAMAAGKPMLTRMSPIPEELWTESLRACPLVDANPENLRDELRRLITNPQLRRELGDAGREYVVKYHSHEAVGRDWELVIEHAWRGTPLPARLKPSNTNTLDGRT
jgi:nucleotide-binding universal stress UspA family protein